MKTVSIERMMSWLPICLRRNLLGKGIAITDNDKEVAVLLPMDVYDKLIKDGRIPSEIKEKLSHITEAGIVVKKLNEKLV